MLLKRSSCPDVDVFMHRCLLSCRLKPTRFPLLRAFVHTRKRPQSKRVVRVELERLERGEFVRDSGVLGSILGHAHKQWALEPNPSSNRWRMAFLHVGAFRRRSVRVEVRKKEFGPDEILHSSIPERLSLPPPPPDETTIDGMPIEIFAEYVDKRLAEMKDQNEMTSSLPLSTMPEEAEVDIESPSPCVEFRTLPFGDGLSEAHRPSGVFRRKKWMPSGQRRQERNRFREAWMQEWTHMWSQKCGDHWVPSSIRRFDHHPEAIALPRQAHLYVEDRGDGSKFDRVNLVLRFLTKQKAFLGPAAPVTSQRKNTVWPKRRHGMERWSFIGDLSNAIREGRFRFDWEQQQCTAARFYRWHTKKRSPPRQHTPSHGLPLFGQEPPLKERLRSAIRASRFRLRNETDDDKDSDIEC